VADAIVLDKVSFAYPGSPPLLRDVSLRVSVGEVVALVGPTGCGKSTLLHLCAGIIPHHQAGEVAGSLTVLGMNVRELTLGAIAAETGVVTQDPENQLFNLFVEDEVAWGMENRGMDLEGMHRHMEEALRFFKIPHLRSRITYDLSGGEKQRVVLAATYAPGPGLFLLDEPTSQLDPLGSEEVLAGIRDLAAEGQTIVLVEEKLEQLWPLVDRVLLLNQGRIQLDIGREELYDHVRVFEEAGIPLPPLVELGAVLRDRGFAIPPLPPLPDDAARVLKEAVPGLLGDSEGRTSKLSALPYVQARPIRLRVSDVSFTYPQPRPTEALKAIDLELPAGAIVAVIGHNGSGKTTLARCMSGELRPTSGSVEIDDRRIHAMSIRERAAHVGYVFQNPDHQIFKDPVIADVAFGPLNLRTPRDRALEISERVLKALNLWDERDIHPFRLSKGGRQRLAIAGVAAMQPPVIIIDEPTTGQDLHESNAIMSLLATMAKEADQTVVVITHGMELVAAYADLVVALDQGRVLAFGSPREVFRDEETLRRTFVKPPSVTALGNRLGLEPLPLALAEVVDAVAEAARAREVAQE
jgi:energy-coupling factor transporter ATP-binding protein EcfA2